MLQKYTMMLVVAVIAMTGCMKHVAPSTEINNQDVKEVEMKPVRFVLEENGLTVLLLNRPSLPIVNVKMLVKAGAVYEPAEKNGLASLVGDLLTEGTKTRSSQEISEEIDFIGGSLSSSGDLDSSSSSMKALKKDVEKGFELLSDIMLNPSFPDSEIERTREEIINIIISEKDEPRRVAEKEFSKQLFGDHPYSRPSIGTAETLKGITKEDILDFYKKFYLPNNSIMSIVGDLSEEEAKVIVKKYFGGWERGEVSLPVLKDVEKTEYGISVIDKELTQANIILGHKGISRGNPDFYPLVLANFILGTGSTSRLYSSIREENGLAYSVYSYFSARKYPGSFSVGLQTKNESAKKAVEMVLVEINKMKNEKVAVEELNDAKSYITGSFPLRIDTNSETASLLMFIEYHDLGLDYFNMYRKRIEGVTVDEIQRVSQKYMDPENYKLVVVANQKEAGY